MNDPLVVDTNVPLVANAATRGDVPWDLECVRACVSAIRRVQEDGGLVLDDAHRILGEYFRGLSRKGMPGLGDAFAKWAWDHQHDERVCEQVVITEDGDSFIEFPDHDGLGDFDLSDRKFVATAAVHGSASVLQAVDSKWWGWKDALREAGVEVRFVCPTTIAALHAGKQKS